MGVNFRARIRLAMRLRQMSERSARTSPDDTAGAGHSPFTELSCCCCAAQVESTGRQQEGIDNLSVTRIQQLLPDPAQPSFFPTFPALVNPPRGYQPC